MQSSIKRNIIENNQNREDEHAKPSITGKPMAVMRSVVKHLACANGENLSERKQ
jgi:hypothetical protein